MRHRYKNRGAITGDQSGVKGNVQLYWKPQRRTDQNSKHWGKSGFSIHVPNVPEARSAAVGTGRPAVWSSRASLALPDSFQLAISTYVVQNSYSCTTWKVFGFCAWQSFNSDISGSGAENFDPAVSMVLYASASITHCATRNTGLASAITSGNHIGWLLRLNFRKNEWEREEN